MKQVVNVEAKKFFKKINFLRLVVNAHQFLTEMLPQKASSTSRIGIQLSIQNEKEIFSQNDCPENQVKHEPSIQGLN